MNTNAFSQKDKERLIRKGNGFEFFSDEFKEIGIIMRHLNYMRKNNINTSLKWRLKNRLNELM